MSLNDKIALITGSSSGIGAAIAKKFSDEGAHVVIIGRNEANLNAVAAQCKNPIIIKAELGNSEEIIQIVDETIKKFDRLDILVNNAGTNVMGIVLNGDLMKAYDVVMYLNFRAVVHLTHLAAPHLVSSKGCIINISSVNGQKTSLIPGMMMYSASKSAVDHFSKDVALELAPYKVRVNVISPGPVRTDILENTNAPITWEDAAKQTVLDRVSEAEEIAEMALFLASDKAIGITGSVMVVDNGTLLKR